MSNNDNNLKEENKLFTEAIPDLLSSYNEIIRNITELLKIEGGNYKVGWLKTEAESFKSMVWQLIKGKI